MWLLFLPVVWWAGAITACAIKPDTNLLQILQVLTEKLDQPFSISYTPYTLRCVFTFTIAYVLGIGIYYSQKKNYRRGVEHGSAKWGDAASICKRYRDKRYTQNLILTQNFRMGLDCYKHKRNLNVLVVGGSGAGKSRAYAVVNIMQCNCSMVVTDPKGELLRKTGGLLEREGYEVRVFDLINPETSFCYNPFAYVRDDKDVLKLINNLIRNTTPKGAQSSDPFWEKSETALLQALMLYLLHEAPPEEQNFSMIMEMLGSAQVKEDDEEYQSPLDILFERLEMRNPESIAVKQYAIYKQAAGKTAKSILISVGVRLAAFNLKQIANLTCTDELDLYSIGEKKVALFCCIPDADTSLNYLVGMIYSNLFQTLYYVADRKYHGKLPIPVHCIMDEWPNVALPDDFDKLLATMRSRAISCSIIIQNIAQMKALFKDSWESLIGNCDEFLYLGGNEKEGHKYVSELLGKETLDTNTYGQTKGRGGSYEAIVTPEEWEQVQAIIDRKPPIMKGNACPFYNLFHGLVYCATCGKSMQVRYEKVGRTGKNRFTGEMREPIDKAYYICQTYNRMGCKVCSSHKIEARDLYNLVLKDIQELAAQAMKDADAFYQHLSSRMERRYLVDASQTEKERKRLEARNQEIDVMFLSLYTDKAKGILTEQRFMKLTAALEQEQESNQKRLHDLAMMQSRADAQESEVRTFIKEIRRYSAIEELDEAMLNRLISRILIGEVKKVDGQKVQKVKIVYNFVGEIPEIAA